MIRITTKITPETVHISNSTNLFCRPMQIRDADWNENSRHYTRHPSVLAVQYSPSAELFQYSAWSKNMGIKTKSLSAAGRHSTRGLLLSGNNPGQVLLSKPSSQSAPDPPVLDRPPCGFWRPATLIFDLSSENWHLTYSCIGGHLYQFLPLSFCFRIMSLYRTNGWTRSNVAYSAVA